MHLCAVCIMCDCSWVQSALVRLPLWGWIKLIKWLSADDDATTQPTYAQMFLDLHDGTSRNIETHQLSNNTLRFEGRLYSSIQLLNKDRKDALPDFAQLQTANVVAPGLWLQHYSSKHSAATTAAQQQQRCCVACIVGHVVVYFSCDACRKTQFISICFFMNFSYQK